MIKYHYHLCDYFHLYIYIYIYIYIYKTKAKTEPFSSVNLFFDSILVWFLDQFDFLGFFTHPYLSHSPEDVRWKKRMKLLLNQLFFMGPKIIFEGFLLMMLIIFQPRIKISVNTDISVIRFYENIGGYFYKNISSIKFFHILVI